MSTHAGATGWEHPGTDPIRHDPRTRIGPDAALPAVFELSGTIAEFGRGERARTYGNDLVGTVRVATREPPRRISEVA